ncbi:ParA family protein [Oribacterium sp. P6A1]|uniref:ParA family protein n=1 Tax=Oribacterium sp. P6A1 TaxID=1410612 RepID=UPI00055AA6CB|nr:ParA family protein [Oribacterium sp. P6A1]
MSILCAFNKKGGVGKTTSCVELACIPTLVGKRSLIVDMDCQGNSSQVYRAFNEENPDITDLLFGSATIDEVLVHSEFGVDVLPNNKHVKRPDQYFYSNGYQEKDLYRLKDVLDKIKENYDTIIIDNNPASDSFSDMSLIASDYVLIPVDSANFSYDGISDVLEDYYRIQQDYNSELQIIGVLLAHVKPRTTLVKQKYTAYDSMFQNIALKSVIRDDNNIAESLSRYMPVYFYDKKSNAGTDYINVAQQLSLIDLDDYKKLLREYSNTRTRFEMDIR